jgi:hypothetical protein
VRSLAAAACAALIVLSQSAIAVPAPESPTSAADALLAKYALAMQTLKQPPNMVVEYTQTRTGPSRVITENHRLYRDAAGHERNETAAVNGVTATTPRVSIYTRATWSYGPDKFFVDPNAYQIALRGVMDVNGRKAYDYAVVLKDAGSFAVTDLQLDARTALPVREHFTAASATCAATGSIEFGSAGGFWLPRIVSVTCPQAVSPDAAVVTPATATYRDTIRFSSYSFPAAIPAQVFGLSPTPVPDVTESPQP